MAWEKQAKALADQVGSFLDGEAFLEDGFLGTVTWTKQPKAEDE